MNTPTLKEIRILALTLLDDTYGISEDAYGALVNFLDEDVRYFISVDKHGRYYIDHDNALYLMKMQNKPKQR